MAGYTLTLTCLRSQQTAQFSHARSAPATWYRAQRAPLPPVLKDAVPRLAHMFNHALAKVNNFHRTGIERSDDGLVLELRSDDKEKQRTKGRPL